MFLEIGDASIDSLGLGPRFENLTDCGFDVQCKGVGLFHLQRSIHLIEVAPLVIEHSDPLTQIHVDVDLASRFEEGIHRRQTKRNGVEVLVSGVDRTLVLLDGSRR